ncbi:MAG: hypothetical protein ACYTBX_10910 [Planctomycetota bacterium]|jgi:hypothetical protein
MADQQAQDRLKNTARMGSKNTKAASLSFAQTSQGYISVGQAGAISGLRVIEIASRLGGSSLRSASPKQGARRSTMFCSQ